MQIVQTQNLTKKYGNLVAVNNINMQVYQGETLGIIGPNGSGKTTLFGMLLQLLKPSKGSISIFGNTNIELEKKRIGATLDTSFYYTYLSAWDHLKMVAHIRNVPTERISPVLQKVGLWGRHHDAVKQYSMGMKQRLAIAIALLHDPELIILDEPTNGLDPKGMIDIRTIIQQLQQEGKTVIIASHILGEIEKVCTRILMIQKGNIIEEVHLQKKEEAIQYFELNSSQITRVYDLLKEKNYIQHINQTASKSIIIGINHNFSTDQMMKDLAQEQLYVNHFMQKTGDTDLEQLFLQLDNK